MNAAWASLRPVRAGLVAWGVLSGAWLLYYRALHSGDCEITYSSPFGCLGKGLLVLVVALPVCVALVGWGLKGKGVAHSIVGSGLCVLVGYRATSTVLHWTHAAFAHVELVGALASAAVTGVLVGVWAMFAPDMRLQRPDSPEVCRDEI